MTSPDIEDMTDAQDEAPMRVYLKPGLIRQAGGYPATLTFPDHPKAIEYIRADLARAKIDHLSETCGYAISQWEDWVRDQFEGTSKFAGAMADIEATRAAVRDSLFADLARPSQAGDARVARLIEAVRGLLHYEIAHVGPYAVLRVAEVRAALAAMDTPKGGGDGR